MVIMLFRNHLSSTQLRIRQKTTSELWNCETSILSGYKRVVTYTKVIIIDINNTHLTPSILWPCFKTQHFQLPSTAGSPLVSGDALSFLLPEGMTATCQTAPMQPTSGPKTKKSAPTTGRGDHEHHWPKVRVHFFWGGDPLTKIRYY